MKNKRGNVFSILDDFYCTDLNAKNNSEFMDLYLTIEPLLREEKHDFVTDLNRNKMCRPIEYNLRNFFNSPESTKKFNLICEAMNLHLKNKLYLKLRPNQYPNVFIGLGGANEFSRALMGIFKDQNGAKLSQGEITLAKVINKQGKLVDFEFRESHPRSCFDPKQMKVIIVEDFVGTGLSIKLAKAYLESLGAEVVAVISLFNLLGFDWPFGIPVNITFQNIGAPDFIKYHPAGKCHYCCSMQRLTHVLEHIIH